jgi:hypothetical protein
MKKMEEKLDFNELQKKQTRIGVRLSPFEKEKLDEFCEQNAISISNLTRYALMQVLNQKQKK